jgi:cytochrome P450
LTAHDPRRPDVLADPYPVLRRLREEDPVHWSEILGGWVLTGYADVRAFLADPRLSADRITPFLAHQTPTASETVQALLRQIGLWINAANRDPRQFEEPDRLDLERTNSRHVAFGHGIHFCLGAALARIEGQIALPGLLARFPALTPRTEAPEWLDSLVFRGMRSLPVALG